MKQLNTRLFELLAETQGQAMPLLRDLGETYPTRKQSKAKAALHDIMLAKTRKHAKASLHVFVEAFENIGDDIGFMFAVLGGDDPGRVHWAPHVIEKARGYGLVLLENGSLIDTTLGETIPVGGAVVHPATRAEIDYIRTPTVEEMSRKVMRHAALHANPASSLATPGVREAAVIGAVRTADGFQSAPIGAPHGFTLRHLALDAGVKTLLHGRDCVEVLLVHRGRVIWQNNAGDSVELSAGDTFTVPSGMPRRLDAVTSTEIFVVRGGNDPGPLQILQNR